MEELKEGIKKGGINQMSSVGRPLNSSKGQSSTKEKITQGTVSSDIKLLNQRLNSQSLRIRKFQEKLAQIVSNQRHYLKLRLPNVLKKEEARVNFATELTQARKLLKSLGKQRFTFLSNSKNEEKRKSRYIGMFTHEEMQRLRRLLDIDHSIDYLLYRKENYKNLKDKHVLLLDESEKRKLKYILTKSKNML